MGIKRWFKGIVGVGLIVAAGEVLNPMLNPSILRFAQGKEQFAKDVLPVAIQGNTKATIEAIKDERAAPPAEFQNLLMVNKTLLPAGGTHTEPAFEKGKEALADEVLLLAQKGETQAIVAVLRDVQASAPTAGGDVIKLLGSIAMGAGGFAMAVGATMKDGKGR